MAASPGAPVQAEAVLLGEPREVGVVVSARLFHLAARRAVVGELPGAPLAVVTLFF